jgi:hypothetical protein
MVAAYPALRSATLTIETSNAQGSPQTYNMAAADVSGADSRNSGRRRREGRQSVAFAAEIRCSAQSLGCVGLMTQVTCRATG